MFAITIGEEKIPCDELFLLMRNQFLEEAANKTHKIHIQNELIQLANICIKGLNQTESLHILK